MLSSASRRSAQPHNGESGESEETGGIEKLCAGLLWLSLPSGHPSPAPWQAQGCLVLLNHWNSTSSSSASHSLPADGWSPTSQAHAPLPVPISATLSPASLFFSPWASHHSTCGVCSSFHVPLILNSGTVLDSKTKGANSKHQSSSVLLSLDTHSLTSLVCSMASPLQDYGAGSLGYRSELWLLGEGVRVSLQPPWASVASFPPAVV